MTSPTSPTHGKLAAIYRMRPNGFKGDGLNDASWGTGFNGASSAYFEVVIQTEGTPDQFKWRKDGGAWTENVSITGAVQTLSDGQTVTFAATTGHTADDQWTIGNLKDEACTESGTEAQITAAAKRLLNPNAPPAWTDDCGETALIVDYTQGKAVFGDNVGAVTVTGNNGYVVEGGLEKVGYLRGWSFSPALDLADAARCGQQWKEFRPGQAGAGGSAEAFFIGGDAFFDGLAKAADLTQEYYLLELFNYDPDQDQSGDHFIAWVIFGGLSIAAPIGELVIENLTFQAVGPVSFKANA
jgi:hypothetical protein